jgi:hypothetical protein
VIKYNSGDGLPGPVADGDNVLLRSSRASAEREFQLAA